MELPIKLDARTNHVHIPVSISGTQYNFTLDTGAVATTVDPKLIEQLGLELYDESKEALERPKIPHRYSRLPNLTIGSVTRDDEEVLVSDLPRLLDNCAGELRSVLGHSTLKHFILTLNYKTGKFKLEEAIGKNNYKWYDFEYLKETHLLTIPVFVNGQGPFPFLLDTGAGGTVITLDFFQKLNLEPLDGVMVKGKGVGGESEAKMALVNEFRTEMLTLSNFPLIAMDLDKVSNRKGLIEYGILGYNFLKEVEIIIDYPNKKIALTRIEE